MFCLKDEFNTNGQTIVERRAYVVIGHGPQARSVYRNVYENEDGEFYVRYDGFIVTVGESGEIWFSEAWGVIS